MSTVFNIRNIKTGNISRGALIIGALIVVLVLVAAIVGWNVYKKLTTNTVVAYFPETLALYPGDKVNIMGIKEAGGSADRVSQLRAVLGQKFTILSGDDPLTLPFMAVGAHGVVSVASNVIPRDVTHMVKAFAMGKSAVALKLHDKFYPLFKDLFIETNPGPVKAALAMMGLIEDEFRLPLVPISSVNRERLRKTMKTCGVLK